MIQFSVLHALSLFLMSSNPLTDSPPEPLQALVSKLHGEWKGNGPCDGRLFLNADGTFERRHFSPGNNSLKGKWDGSLGCASTNISSRLRKSRTGEFLCWTDDGIETPSSKRRRPDLSVSA